MEIDCGQVCYNIGNLCRACPTVRASRLRVRKHSPAAIFLMVLESFSNALYHEKRAL